MSIFGSRIVGEEAFKEQEEKAVRSSFGPKVLPAPEAEPAVETIVASTKGTKGAEPELVLPPGVKLTK